VEAIFTAGFREPLYLAVDSILDAVMSTVIIVAVPQTHEGYYLRARIQARWPWATVVLVPKRPKDESVDASTRKISPEEPSGE